MGLAEEGELAWRAHSGLLFALTELQVFPEVVFAHHPAHHVFTVQLSDKVIRLERRNALSLIRRWNPLRLFLAGGYFVHEFGELSKGTSEVLVSEVEDYEISSLDEFPCVDLEEHAIALVYILVASEIAQIDGDLRHEEARRRTPHKPDVRETEEAFTLLLVVDSLLVELIFIFLKHDTIIKI